MTFSEICQLISSITNKAIFKETVEDVLQPYVVVAAEDLKKVMHILFEHEQLYFDYLSCLTGIDNGPEKGTMEVIYNLYSIPYNYHFTVRVIVDRNKGGEALPSVPTIADIWKSADWHERETYDLLGINFEGHPDLRRLLMPSDWEGYPLRKDYKEMKKYHGIKVAY